MASNATDAPAPKKGAAGVKHVTNDPNRKHAAEEVVVPPGEPTEFDERPANDAGTMVTTMNIIRGAGSKPGKRKE